MVVPQASKKERDPKKAWIDRSTVLRVERIVKGGKFNRPFSATDPPLFCPTQLAGRPGNPWVAAVLWNPTLSHFHKRRKLVWVLWLGRTRNYFCWPCLPMQGSCV
jgi:hypothetical protein